VNTNDYVNPVHHFLDDYWVSLDPNRGVFYQSYFKNNILNLYDDYLGFINPLVTQNFYQHSDDKYFTMDVNAGTGVGCYFEQDFKIDKEYDIYERKVYSLSNVLSDTGGFYNSLFFIGLIIYS
jgi:hypothetical protein